VGVVGAGLVITGAVVSTQVVNPNLLRASPDTPKQALRGYLSGRPPTKYAAYAAYLDG
jgi:hypothetical protein